MYPHVATKTARRWASVWPRCSGPPEDTRRLLVEGTDDPRARDAVVEGPPVATQKDRGEPDADGGDGGEGGERTLHRACWFDVAVVFTDDADARGHLADGLSSKRREDREIRRLHQQQEQRQRQDRYQLPFGKRQASDLE